ncbi:biliverdin-producing heme oxygenase [Legionella cardiaca]|uniref:Biliverdin-producing heme oxygenase n=1 Tax=Legionella cardiaca TaxID=1071983 RepID=A0ABY8APP8_9GAMM|nr:biliverdin-producing heme oxygenase [Legionella cardiaca]WED42693.1 biliverdin-producing heme oxygenase [Legionella cardiaca]
MFRLYSKALLAATYKDGKPGGQLTQKHREAEYHPFKTEHLFKNAVIPKDLYGARLIQQFLIIKALEKRLQGLSTQDKSEISAFFALTYLENLWRTAGMEKDLQQLDIDPNKISEGEKTKSTKKYLEDIEKLPPKLLLAHFLEHVAGFLHGGAIVKSKYILPSNQLTSYQITTHQYDFSSTGKSSMSLYKDIMDHVDKITLDEMEYEQIFKECGDIYLTMTNIYNDLCKMHIKQPKLPDSSLVGFTVSIFVLAVVLKLLANYVNQVTPQISYNP